MAGGNYRPPGLVVPTTTRSGELGKIPVARFGSNIFFVPEFLWVSRRPCGVKVCYHGFPRSFCGLVEKGDKKEIVL